MGSRIRKSIAAAIRTSGLDVRVAALLVSFTWLFIELADDVWRREGFPWDAPSMLAIHRLSRPWLDTTMWWVTQTGSALAVLFLAILVAWLLYERRTPEAVLFPASFFGAVSVNYLLKQVFARPRPEIFPPLVVSHTYSFPSGHTIASASLYGLLAVYLWDEGRKTLALLSAFWILAVAFSRVYLGAHYPSDVLGAMAMGGIWVICVWEVYVRFRRQGDD
jgi:membrane-associated phospholipid phosphatase